MTRKQARRSQSSTDGSVAAPNTQHNANSAADSITQVDRLSELIDQEVKKPNPSHPETSSAERTDEEALQAYLNQFMERMTGKKTETRPELALTSAWPANKPIEAVQKPVETASPREPSRPPECRDQLAAMRELANKNARDAVAEHACRDLSSKISMAFLGAAVVSVLSSCLAVLALQESQHWAVGGAGATFAVALLLACRFYGLYQKIVR
jgi:hypothetical protein